MPVIGLSITVFVYSDLLIRVDELRDSSVSSILIAFFGLFLTKTVVKSFSLVIMIYN
jgi:hypothetical protein